MILKREWVTPLTVGAFLLSAVTGVLLFFKVELGASKFVHEWLSWLLLGGVVAHVVTNIHAFKYHLTTRTGQVVMGLFAIILAATLLVSSNGGAGGEPPFLPPLRALGQLPMTSLAQIARISPEQLRDRLVRAGVQPTSDAQSLSELVGDDMRKQIPLLKVVFSPSK